MGGNVNSVWAEHKELKQHIIKMEDQVRKTHLQKPLQPTPRRKLLPRCSQTLSERIAVK